MDKGNANAPNTPTIDTPIDDDAITTSTESDTFDTWTLVTDKKQQQQQPKQKQIAQEKTTAKASGVQVLSNTKDVQAEENDDDNDVDEDSERHESQHDSSIDELSDGISIISESDGAASGGGRISPHPFLREHLNDLSFKFSSTSAGLDDLPLQFDALKLPENLELKSSTIETTPQMRQRRHTRRGGTPTSPSITGEQALQPTKSSSSLLLAMPPIVVRGLTGLFYACVALVVLAFLGKLRHMAWNETLGGVGHPPIEQLEQKLDDIELQNNLMRAEIDLLSKQVNYLSNLKDKSSPYQQPSSHEHYDKKRNLNEETAKRGKAFKAWLGNGKTIEPVDIAKEDLHRPYECADGKFVEVAGMCLDSAPNLETLVDEFGNVLNEALKTPAFATETTEQQPTVESAAPQPQQSPKTQQTHKRPQPSSAEQFVDDRMPQGAENSTNSKERRQYYENKHKRQSQQKQQQQQQQPQQGRKHRNGSNEHDDDDDDSKEHQKHHKRGNNSKERQHHDKNNNKQQYKKQIYNSKERIYNNNKNEQKPQRRNSEERHDGDWHEKRMQQREHAREQQQQQRDNNSNNNKNWYIKRGDSREKIRHSTGSGERQR